MALSCRRAVRTPGLSPAPGLPARGRQGTNYYKIIVTDDGRVWGRVKERVGVSRGDDGWERFSAQHPSFHTRARSQLPCHTHTHTHAYALRHTSNAPSWPRPTSAAPGPAVAALLERVDFVAPARALCVPSAAGVLDFGPMLQGFIRWGGGRGKPGYSFLAGARVACLGRDLLDRRPTHKKRGVFCLGLASSLSLSHPSAFSSLSQQNPTNQHAPLARPRAGPMPDWRRLCSR